MRLAQPFRCFEPVQAFDQDVALAIQPHLNRNLHPVLQNILGKDADGFGMQGLAPFGRHVNRLDRDIVDAQHVSPLAGSRLYIRPIAHSTISADAERKA